MPLFLREQFCQEACPVDAIVESAFFPRPPLLARTNSSRTRSSEHRVHDRDARGATLQQGEAALCVPLRSLFATAVLTLLAANGDRMEAEIAANLHSDHVYR